VIGLLVCALGEITLTILGGVWFYKVLVEDSISCFPNVAEGWLSFVWLLVNISATVQVIFFLIALIRATVRQRRLIHLEELMLQER
jgi:hypothetical protein